MTGSMRRQGGVLGTLVAACAAAFFSATAAAGEAADFERLIAQHSRAVVTVKFVLRVKGGMGGAGGQETESEAPGLMIDPEGLVLCSNTTLSGFVGLLKRMMGRVPGLNISAEPSDVKVVIGADEEEFEAKIMARDAELDLAWIQIENPGAARYEAVDLSDSEDPALGQTVICVRRLSMFFDRTPVVRTGLIVGRAEKPRKLWISEGELTGSMGLPAFSSRGKPVGFVVLQLPEEEGTQGSFNPFAMLGSIASMQDSMRGVILPAAEVVKATRRAREAAAAAPEL